MAYDTIRTDTEIQWATVRANPDRTVTFELHRDERAATASAEQALEAGDLRRSVRYRLVDYGEWVLASTTSFAGGAVQWGVRHEWPDGYAEYEIFPTRRDADRGARYGLAGSTRQTVYRTVTCGEWLPWNRAQDAP
jgi:hypothetical protein